MSADMSYVTPEYLAETRVPALLATIWVTRIIAWVFIGLRFYAKRRGGTKYGWDDWTLMIPTFFTVVAIPNEVLAITYGVGRHVEYVFAYKADTLDGYGKALYAEQVLYSPMVGGIKLSILLFYIRMFGHNTKFLWACRIQIAAVITWIIVVFLLFALQCTPVHVGWNITRQGGTCLQYSPLFIGTNTVNVIMDFIILITPIPTILGLQLPKTKKIAVVSVLAFGACESIFSSVRLGVLAHANFTDPTWQHVDAFIWSLVEIHMGMVCACLPLLGPLLPGRGRKSNTHAYGNTYDMGGSRRSAGRQTPMGWSKMDPHSQHGKVTELTNRSDSDTDTAGILQTREWTVSSEPGHTGGRGHGEGVPFEGRSAPR